MASQEKMPDRTGPTRMTCRAFSCHAACTIAVHNIQRSGIVFPQQRAWRAYRPGNSCALPRTGGWPFLSLHARCGCLIPFPMSVDSPASACPTDNRIRWLVPVWIYMVAWTILPALLTPGMPLDVAEGISWGKEWQWGYYKHPPLPSWLVYLSDSALGITGPYLLGQLSIALTLWLVYRLGQHFFDKPRALVAALLLLGIYYYGWPAPEFNHNVAQLPVWAGIALFFWRAVNQDRWQDWCGLGLWCGIGLLVKYSVLVLMLCLFLFFILSSCRTLARRPGPWISALLALLVASPHLAWLARHAWLPIVYASQRAQVDMSSQVPASLMFASAQVLAHLPVCVILLAAGLALSWRQGAGLSGPAARPFSRPLPARTGAAFLWVIALAPAGCTFLLGLNGILGLHDMWGSPMWNFSGLLVVSGLRPSLLAARQDRLRVSLVTWLLVLTVGMALYLGVSGQWRQRPSRLDWPARALAEKADMAWSSLSSCPLDVIAGDYWLAGLVASSLAQHPSVLIQGDPRFSPWISTERLQQKGALWMEKAGDAAPVPALLAELDTRSGHFQLAQGTWQLPWTANPAWPPLQVHWLAYVPTGCSLPE